MESVNIAVVVSVTITLLLLFSAGFFRGYMLRTNGLRDGIETLLLGGGIISVGLISGIIVNSL
jgi:VIT1/CCC1 family predicted Fe2+/Mn2+ transporter